MKKCLLTLLIFCFLGDCYILHNVRKMKDIRAQTAQLKKPNSVSA